MTTGKGGEGSVQPTGVRVLAGVAVLAADIAPVVGGGVAFAVAVIVGVAGKAARFVAGLTTPEAMPPGVRAGCGEPEPIIGTIALPLVALPSATTLPIPPALTVPVNANEPSTMAVSPSNWS